MLKQTIQYKDFNGELITEDFYFNFTMLEMIEQVEVHQVNKKIEHLTEISDGAGAYLLFKGIVLDAYGIKSPDGKKFDKSPTIRHDFETSAAISELIISFLQDAEKGIAFIRGVLPEEMLKDAVAQVEAARAAQAAEAGPVPGVHLASARVVSREALGEELSEPVRLVETLDAQTQAEADDDKIAADDVRIKPGTPVDRGVEMTTAEKRMYTGEELEAVQGAEGEVPVAPREYTDAEILNMDPQELVRKGLIMRAYQLKSQS